MNLLFGILFIMVGVVTSQDFVGKKDLPELQDKAFIAKFHIVIADKGTTLYGIEKYDETQKMASLTTISGDQGNVDIVNYADQTLAAVTFNPTTKMATGCELVGLDLISKDTTSGSGDILHYFGGWGRTKGAPHMFSSKNMFRMNTTTPFVYKGTKDIDGIPADRWTTTMKWTDDKDTFTVDYYFTPVGWQSAQSRGQNRVYPLRIEITGKKTTPTGVKSIHHYYEYLDFVGYDRLDPSEFEIPEGSLCKTGGSLKFRPVPKIPDTISYTREVVDGSGNVVVDNVVYDKKVGLMQIESADREALYDFNSGVYYESKGMGCTTRAIDPATDANAKQLDNFVQDIGPAEFYLMGQTLTYRGQSRSRQIEALAYGNTYNNVLFDAYFAKMDWKFSPGFSSMPLSMDREGKHYNFFNFKSTATSLRTNYLWGACRSYKERKTIKLTFFSKYYTTKEQLITDDNIAKISDAVAKEAKLSYSRVQVLLRSADYDSQSKSLTLYARLFGPPSPEFMYLRRPSKVLNTQISPKIVTLDKADEITSMTKSAGICEETAASTQFNCRSYDLCRKSDGGYTMRMFSKLPSGVSLKQDSNCDHYSRSVDGEFEVTLDTAMANLKDGVSKGFLTVTANTTNSYYNIKLSAIAVEPAFSKDFKFDKSSRRTNFKMVPYKSSLTKAETVKAKSSDDCARICLEREYYACKAFQWCFGTMECILSADFPQKNSSAVNKACYISKRNYISEFKPLAGLTAEYKSKNAFHDVADANTCAAKCMENKKNYNCESFDYCKDTKECLLSETHYYSVPVDKVKKVSPKCTHYSKNYVLDFEAATNTALSSDDKNGLQTMVASAEQCAHYCKTGLGQTCVQFDFCADKYMCQFSTVQTKSYVAHVAKLNCTTYTLTDAQKAVANSKFTASKSSTYSNASFGGLAFGMVLLGICLGACILFILHRKGALSRFVNY